MNTLIRRYDGSYFDAATKEWKSNPGEATPFNNPTEAIAVCLNDGLAGVQLVLQDGDGTLKGETAVDFA